MSDDRFNSGYLNFQELGNIKNPHNFKISIRKPKFPIIFGGPMINPYPSFCSLKKNSITTHDDTEESDMDNEILFNLNEECEIIDEDDEDDFDDDEFPDSDE